MAPEFELIFSDPDQRGLSAKLISNSATVPAEEPSAVWQLPAKVTRSAQTISSAAFNGQSVDG